MLIPGSHHDSRQWDEVVGELGEGLGLALLELPGHGHSSSLPDRPSIENAPHNLPLERPLEVARAIMGLIAEVEK